jgi:hypothetical protein
MKSTSEKRFGFLFLIVLFVSRCVLAEDIPLKNWTVPAYRAQSAAGGVTTMADVSEASVFVAVDPCRLVDTRQAGFPAGYGPPALSGGVPRNFDLDSDPQCPGIPAGVAAYSLNFTVTNVQGPGFLKVFPQGGSIPLDISTLNYIPGQNIANAAIVPAGTGGGITVISGVSGTDLIIDINGYFMDAGGVLNDGIHLKFVGNTTNAFMIIQNNNTNTASGFTNAIRGLMSSNQTSVSAIRGEMNSTSGANYGVTAVTGSVSDNAAGLRGHDGGGPLAGTYTTAGVRGESGGTANFGVLGLSRAVGVGGFRVNISGDVVTGGNLGFSDTVGVAALGETSATGTKNFLEPHPSDASKMIRYISLEGNEAGTYFRGRGKFQNGIAVIQVPEDFRIVTDAEGLSIQVTPIGQMASVAVESIGLDRIVVRGSRNVEFFYTVNGIRHAYKHYGPIAENDKMFVPQRPDEPMPAYLPAVLQQRLISNGTYTAEGKVNMETAHRLGWDKIWQQRLRPAPEPTP